jgi:uncharacterized protein YndB with AHSA1/START domain
MTFEMPGTPEQVWDAMATANGSSSWFIPTTSDERAGGAIAFHMGPDGSSEGSILEWEPPRRVVYEEPDWAALTGHDGEVVTPMVTEYLIEARSGGTCSVRVVSSAFGTGADWEREFFAEMEKGWRPFFHHLRLYLTHFPGQQVTSLEAQASVDGGDAEVLRKTMRDALGEVGETVTIRGTTGVVERIDDMEVLLRLSAPVPGYMAFFSQDRGPTAVLQLAGYLFADDATDYVAREQSEWQAWLETLVTAGSYR